MPVDLKYDDRALHHADRHSRNEAQKQIDTVVEFFSPKIGNRNQGRDIVIFMIDATDPRRPRNGERKGDC